MQRWQDGDNGDGGGGDVSHRRVSRRLMGAGVDAPCLFMSMQGPHKLHQHQRSYRVNS